MEVVDGERAVEEVTAALAARVEPLLADRAGALRRVQAPSERSSAWT